MTHRGYTAAVAYDVDDHVFSGRVVGLRDVLYFEGKTVAELEEGFRAVVEDYLAICAENGKEPDRPYSGWVGLRLDAALHRAAAARAAEEGKSLNDLVVEAISERVRRRGVGPSLVRLKTRRRDAARPGPSRGSAARSLSASARRLDFERTEAGRLIDLNR